MVWSSIPRSAFVFLVGGNIYVYDLCMGFGGHTALLGFIQFELLRDSNRVGGLVKALAMKPPIDLQLVESHLN